MDNNKKITIARMKVYPVLAEMWLSKSKGNRTESNKKINEYAELMKSGQWGFSNDLIVFDENGVLRNGHHRLHALIKAGVTVEFYVAFCVPKDAWMYFDTGKTRGVDSMLEIEQGDKVKHARTIAAIGRLICGYEKMRSFLNDNNGIYTFPAITEHLSQKDVFEYTNKYFDKISESLTFAVHGNGQKSYTSPLAAFVFLARQAGKEEKALEDYVSKLATLENLERFSPILALHRRLQSIPMHTVGNRCKVLILFIKAFEYFSDKRQISAIQMPTCFIDIKSL